jgi:UDP-N-acetylmuramate dehydrogenase
MSIRSTTNSKIDKLGPALRERFGERVRENCQLGPFTRVGVGGVVEYLIVAETAEELVTACRLAVEADRPYAVIAGGTATIPSHVGALGLVVVNAVREIYFAETNSLVVAESGATTQGLITQAASRGLGGLEFLMAIPGTVGGAVATDAYYRGQSIRSFIRSVSLWVTDGTNHQVLTLSIREADRLLKEAKRYLPVILTLHIQFSQLYREEIVRRLSSYQVRARKISDRRSIIGSPFSPFVEDQQGVFAPLDRIRQSGLRLHVADGIISTTKQSLQPAEYRHFIQALQQAGTSIGQALDDRLTYLGYWPDEGENAAL